jgi:hypothetical protein
MKTGMACLVLCSILVAGCAGSQYFGDRGRDALDMVAATGGFGAGVKARVGPLHIGLLTNLDMWGTRNGVLLVETCGMVGGIEADSLFIPMSSGSELPTLFPVVFGVTGFPTRKCGDAGALSHVPFISLPTPTEEDAFLPWAEQARYLSQIEVVVGVGVSGRLGVNPLELVDFVLGWTTLDILGDDTSRDFVIRVTHDGPVPDS